MRIIPWFEGERRGGKEAVMTPGKDGQVELHKLIYTANWEDPESDRMALRIQPGDTLMTITSGGCNTLGFLIHDPAAIHTVDINSTQAYQLELKMAAMKDLGYWEFTGFLGLAPSRDRLEIYASLRTQLSPGARRFWDAHGTILRKGFILHGSYDAFVNLVGRYVRLGHGRKRVDGLLEARGLEEQRAFYDRFWDIRRTRWVFQLFYNKRVLARIGLEADYFRFDDGSSSFAESFLKKFRKVIQDVPVRGNYFVHLYLKGRYRSLDEVPDYLREEHYETIRSRLCRIHVMTADAKKWLAEQPDSSIDVFAMSNICELMDLADTRLTFQEVLRTAKPGARVCFRNLIIPREVPEDLRVFIRKNGALSKRIKNADRSFVYSKVAAYEVFK
jgi:S-adenosylmethionine-diacylglycerol 3-amino-3-carboxypropyl transferase